MNKREKEVFEGLLDREDLVLRDLKRQYERALRDINDKIRLLQSDEMTQSRIYQINYQKALKGQVEAILDKLHGDEYSTIQKYLSDSYTDAYVGTMYAMSGNGIHVITPIDRNAAVKAIITDSELKFDLYTSLGYDMDILKKHIREEITRGIATSLPYEQIARNISNFTELPMSNAKRIVRTEGHRIQQASANDARNEAKAKGADVVKQWDASLDGATRPLHRELDGQIRETDEPFEAGGKKVMYPGKFGDPSQDCNCRCVALTRARWALDEKELETLKERAAYFGLDKMKEFEGFRSKYIQSANELKEREGDDMWSEAKETEWQKSRKVYGKADGQNYRAQKNETVVLESKGRKEINGEWQTVYNVDGEYTVAANENGEQLVVTQLPKKTKFGMFDETKNTILTNGRIAINYSSGNNNTREIVTAMVENEIDILGGIREDGVFYRVTSNDKEAGYIKAGKIRASKNHMTGEKEDGLSVWETVKYADKHLHKISGEVIGIGSDGEPILKTKSVKMIEEDVSDIVDKRKQGRELFKKKYNWTDAQIDQALRGGYKKIR